MAELTSLENFQKKYPFRSGFHVNDLGSAKIYKVTLPDNAVVAVKRIQRIAREKFAESDMNIHRLLVELGGNEFIPILMDSCITPTEVYIAMEYCKYDSLHSLIRDFFEYGLQDLELSEFAEILVEMLQCINFLHSHDIIHRDIKPDNFLINEFAKIKLCDFGFATSLSELERTYCGTIDFIAPEIIEQHVLPCVGKNLVGKHTDVWSFGITAYELAYANTPWNEKNVNSVSELAKEIGKLLIKKDITPYFDLPKKQIEPLDLLLRECLMIDTEKRLTVEKLLQRPHLLSHFVGNDFTYLKKLFS